MNFNSSTFDWNHARAFLITAEEGTLSAAAKVLGITQPTLSRQVAALEAELGISLFERVGQRLVLTESGMTLLEKVRSMGEAATQFSLAATGQSQQIEGLVTISASQLDAIFRLPKIIAELRQEEPGIDIEVVVTNEVSDLKRREADIAIRNFHPTQNDLIARKVTEEKIGLYGTQAYLDSLIDHNGAANLEQLQIIGFDQGSSVMNTLNAQGWNLSQRNFSLITSFQMLQFQLCKQSLGLIFFPEDLADEAPELRRAFEDQGPLMTLPVWLVCHQELRTNRRIRRVFDFLAEAMGQKY